LCLVSSLILLLDMATTPPRRSNVELEPPTPKSNARRGRWAEGTWWCDCNPPRKAASREVTNKSSFNKGKFFWTCPISSASCGFFLWKDAAKARETGPAAPDAENEAQKPKTPTLAQRTLTSFGFPVTPRRRLSEPEQRAEPAPAGAGADNSIKDNAVEDSVDTPATIVQMPSSRPVPAEASTKASTGTAVSSKRKQDDLDDDFFEDLDSDGERELSAILNNPSPSKTNSFTTPSSSRSFDTVGGLPTPSVTRTLFPGSSSKRHKTVSFEEPLEDATSPTAVHQPGPSSSPVEAGVDVIQEVMSLLKGQNLKPSVLESVQTLLDTSARKSRGFIMARDSARDALKAKDVKIARLQERITALENKEKMLNSQLTKHKANIMQVYRDM
jgi:hypothetical protein